jgi:hypothetical protein
LSWFAIASANRKPKCTKKLCILTLQNVTEANNEQFVMTKLAVRAPAVGRNNTIRDWFFVKYCAIVWRGRLHSRRNLMQKLVIAATAAVLLLGSFAMQAQAQTLRGAADISTAAQNFTPIQKAACQGWGPYCGPGFVRACNRWRCWCRPCW